MTRWLWRVLWNLSEYTGIGLGRFAPLAFGKMIGSQPKEVDSLGRSLPTNKPTQDKERI